MKVCHRCGTPWESSTPTPGVKETCEQCSAYLHCCLNCKFYDTSKPYDCYIPNIDPVTDKAAANFCDEFTFADQSEKEGATDKNQRSRDAFNELFDEEPDEDNGPKSFDDLFGS